MMAKVKGDVCVRRGRVAGRGGVRGRWLQMTGAGGIICWREESSSLSQRVEVCCEL
jgi:hypothetical protein